VKIFSLCEAEEARISAICKATTTKQGGKRSQTNNAGYIALEGICAALFAQLAYYYALKYGDVGRVSPLVAAFPLVAVFLGIVFLGEKLTVYKVLAALLIVSGITLLKL
jgi:transporter family protein